MKYLKKKQKKHGPLIIGLVFVLLVVAFVFVILPPRSKDKVQQTEPTTVATEAIEAAETTEPTAVSETATMPEEVIIKKPVIREYDVVELVDGQIQTPYGALSYPEALADHLLIINASQQPYTIEFYAVMQGKQEIRLFDISLGEGSGGNMGMVQMPEGEVSLNVTIYALELDSTWTEDEMITAYAMQDVVNEMIEQMAPKTEAEEGATIYNLEIETPYCTLYYPARWSNTVTWEIDESQEDVYKVHVYSRIEGMEKQLLFSIYFGGDEGEQLGVVMGKDDVPVPVYLVMEQLQIDGVTDDNLELLYAMQEASNQLIEKLPLLD